MTTRSTPSKHSTGSGTGTTRPDGGFRAVVRSRIARLIFFWNFVGLAILVLGVLLLSETRAGLIEAQVRNLRTQGELIANLLIETGTVQGDPYPAMNEPAVREVLRRLLPPVAEGARPGVGPRVRVFSADHDTLVADSDVLYDKLEERPLPEIGVQPDLGESLERAASRVEYLRITPWRPTITLAEEQRLAFHGQIAFGQRLNENGERVVSVTLPIRRVNAVLGAVTLESADVERILVAERAAMIPFVVASATVTFLSSWLLALFVARPLRRLAEAADRLRLTGATRLRLPDVTKRRDEIGALGHSLEAMTEALAERIDANERFAADVSHEIKNPLASIRSAIDTARAVRDPNRQTELLAIAAQDVKRLDRLITDIARASRIEAETARGDFVPINLGRFLTDLVHAYAPPPEEPVQVRVVFRGPAPEDAVVMGQEGPLGQVFRNLIDNARSFSPGDGVVTVAVETARGRDGPVVRATVEDQGPGIPPDNLETIFRRFYTQRPRGAAFGNNSGLGLSIARQILEALGGRIHAENIPGSSPEVPAGARLVVELPQAHARQ
ncbi:MAG TPA: ATP-binding protein [Caulobacterales bacterium]|nr:ATP-binding protein [Caulobacterales bacterium]